tara:strand:- start:447 stop:680 length:234 start_codon:yes stop_codon:yes gene_type:complete
MSIKIKSCPLAMSTMGNNLGYEEFKARWRKEFSEIDFAKYYCKSRYWCVYAPLCDKEREISSTDLIVAGLHDAYDGC